LQDPEGLQQLQGLTRLQDLCLEIDSDHIIKASMFSGLQRLSRLVFRGGVEGGMFEAGVVAAKWHLPTHLRHLVVQDLTVVNGSAGVAELLSHLQPLQHLTHLGL
jgi:hypothetical protein